MKTFGEKLKDARLNKGLKQSEVAEKLDCAPTSLTNWENGKIMPSMEVLSKLCEVYEIKPLSLLDKQYEYTDIVTIAGKPVPARSYEEQVAINFSEPILAKLLMNEVQRKETERIEKTSAFLNDTNLLTRFGGSVTKTEIETVMTDYDENGNADNDILFAFHALTAGSKAAFLSMLSGLLADKENLQQFSTDNMAKAQEYTLERLAEQRKELKIKKG